MPTLNKEYYYYKISTDGRFTLPNGSYIAYRKRCGSEQKPGLLFCSGLLSSLNGNKAIYLDKYCEKNNLSYVRFDYIGQEFSSGTMEDFTMSLWKQNTLDVLDHLTKGSSLAICTLVCCR